MPDGRIVVQTRSAPLPGELIVEPPRDPEAPMEPFWPDGYPDDGSVQIDVEDAATIDGVAT